MKNIKTLGILLAIILATTSVMARNNILISEVLYNPAGNENALEYIEIFNPNDVSVNVGGWVIKTSSYEKDATIPNGTVILAKSHFLIADAGFFLAKPAEWPSAGYEEAMTLSNTAGGVALMSNNAVEDSVGWGTINNPELFEGTPTALGEEGESLGRKTGSQGFIDTNNNSNDFSYQTPSPSNSVAGAGSTKDMQIELIIEDSAPEVIYIKVIDEAPEEQGIQVFPSPGLTKNMQVLIAVSDFSGISDISEARVSFNNQTANLVNIVNQTQNTRVYSAQVPIAFHLKPGVYPLSASVCDGSDCGAFAINIEIGEILAFIIDTSKLSLGSNKGGSFQLLGDLDTTTLGKPTIKNTGNIPLNFMASTEGLQLNSSMIPPSSIGIQLSKESPSEFFELSSRYFTDEPMGVQELIRLSLNFEVPASINPGVYHGRISLTALK